MMELVVQDPREHWLAIWAWNKCHFFVVPSWIGRPPQADSVLARRAIHREPYAHVSMDEHAGRLGLVCGEL